MSHSYVTNLMHCAFSTKERYPFIDLELEQRLWPYIGGIARVKKMKAFAIGGTNDHIRAAVPTGDNELCQSSAAYQRRLIQMGL